MAQQKRLQSFLDTVIKLVTQPEVYIFILGLVSFSLFMREPETRTMIYTSQQDQAGELQTENWKISVTAPSATSGEAIFFSESDIVYPAQEVGESEVFRFERFASVETNWVGTDLSWSGVSAVLWHIETSAPVTITTTSDNETHFFYGVIMLVCLGLWSLRIVIWLLGRHVGIRFLDPPENET